MEPLSSHTFRKSVLIDISADAKLSSAATIGVERLCGVLIPSSWDTATISFWARMDGQNYRQLFDKAGNALSLTVAADSFVVFDEVLKSQLSGIDDIKLKSSADQSADRTILLLTE